MFGSGRNGRFLLNHLSNIALRDYWRIGSEKHTQGIIRTYRRCCIYATQNCIKSGAIAGFDLAGSLYYEQERS